MSTSLVSRKIPRKICIFRHGETDWNREQRFQGHLDVPLNDLGRAQARELALKLTHEGLEAILSSDLSRARETGEIVAKACQVRVFVDPGLREAHLGEMQGHTREQIEAKLGKETVDRWRSMLVTDADVAYPGGETGLQVQSRAFLTLEKFLTEQPYRCIGVATHGGIIRRIMQKLLPPGSPPVKIPNGIVYHLEYVPEDKRWGIKP